MIDRLSGIGAVDLSLTPSLNVPPASYAAMLASGFRRGVAIIFGAALAAGTWVVVFLLSPDFAYAIAGLLAIALVGSLFVLAGALVREAFRPRP